MPGIQEGMGFEYYAQWVREERWVRVERWSGLTEGSYAESR